MLSIPVTFMTVAGTAFLVASYANPVSETGLAPPAAAIASDRAVASGKGDLLAPRRALERSSVFLIEVVGAGHATVTLRGRDGIVLYRSDPSSSTTVVSKNAEIPTVTLKGDPLVPVVARTPAPTPALRQPTVDQQGGEVPAEAPRKKKPIGCETAVSSLARGIAEQLPSRCLADAGTQSVHS